VLLFDDRPIMQSDRLLLIIRKPYKLLGQLMLQFAPIAQFCRPGIPIIRFQPLSAGR